MHHLPVIGDFWASVRLKFVFLKFDRVNQFRKSIDLLTGLGQEEQCSPAGAYRAEPTRPKPSARFSARAPSERSDRAVPSDRARRPRRTLDAPLQSDGSAAAHVHPLYPRKR
jgi:hypothetical protein